MPSRRAVFLDRDGVINRDSPDFIKTPEEMILFPGAPQAIARLDAAGFAVMVVSNQSGLARGLITPESLEAMHRKLHRAVEEAGGRLTGIYFCPHLPDAGCACRKPKTGMLEQAAREHGIALSESYMAGDKPDDIACGRAAGCRTILILSGQTRRYDPARFAALPDLICPDLPAAAEQILRESEGAPGCLRANNA